MKMRTVWFYAHGKCWRKFVGLCEPAHIRQMANGIKPYSIKVSLRAIKQGLPFLQDNTVAVYEGEKDPTVFFCPCDTHNDCCFYRKQRRLDYGL